MRGKVRGGEGNVTRINISTATVCLPRQPSLGPDERTRPQVEDAQQQQQPNKQKQTQRRVGEQGKQTNTSKHEKKYTKTKIRHSSHLPALEKSECRHSGNPTLGRDRVLVIDVHLAKANGLAVLLADRWKQQQTSKCAELGWNERRGTRNSKYIL